MTLLPVAPPLFLETSNQFPELYDDPPVIIYCTLMDMLPFTLAPILV